MPFVLGNIVAGESFGSNIEMAMGDAQFSDRLRQVIKKHLPNEVLNHMMFM